MNSTKTRTIFFDLDGVLLDGSIRSYKTYAIIVKELGGVVMPIARYMPLKRAKTTIDVILKISKIQDKSGQFNKRWLELIESEAMMKHNRLYDDVHEVLSQLSIGSKLHLITLRNNRALLIAELKRNKLFPYFEEVISTTNGQRDKAILLREFASPGDVIIGDSETEIRAGKALGITTIAATTGFRNYRLIKKEKPDFIIRKLSRILLLLRRHESAQKTAGNR